ncbi:hypothetical protein [Vibrio harveyi]|uniref:hypothetical protein n=1 Tax=Vibrio harveyi TaxID=669 RepID=UPI003CEB84E8
MANQRKINADSNEKYSESSPSIKCIACKAVSDFEYTVSEGSVFLKCGSCGDLSNLSSYATFKRVNSFFDSSGSEEERECGQLNLCKLHTIGRNTSGLTVSTQVLMNALYDSKPLTFNELLSMYGASEWDHDRPTGFISDTIAAANKGNVIFKVAKIPGQPKEVSLSHYGKRVYEKIDQEIGGFSPRGLAQMMHGSLAKKAQVSFNVLAFIEAIGDGTTYADLSFRYGVPNHNARIYGFVGTLIKNTDKGREQSLFKVSTATEQNLQKSESFRDYHRKKPRWVELTPAGVDVLNQIQELKEKYGCI